MLKVILKGHPSAEFFNAHSFGGYTALHLAYQFKQADMIDHLEAGLSAWRCASAGYAAFMASLAQPLTPVMFCSSTQIWTRM